MDTALATVIGVAIGGLLAVFGNYLNNRHSLRQQREQWEREEKKAQREEEERRKGKELEAQEQFKTYLREIYANSVRYLSEIHSYSHSRRDEVRYKEAELELHKNIAEANRWLALLTMYHYNKEDPSFNQFFCYRTENMS